MPKIKNLPLKTNFEGNNYFFPITDGTTTYKTGINDIISHVTPEAFGAVGDGIHDDTAAIQAAINAATNNGSKVSLGGKSYLISSTISVTCPINGLSPNETFINPNGSFPALDIRGTWLVTGDFGDFRIDYSKVGATNITSSAIGMRLMYASTTNNEQIHHTRFKNIVINYSYRGISYDASSNITTHGQLWNVSFEQILINYPKDYGFYFSCSNSTLGVYFRDCIVEGAFGMSSWYSSNSSLWSASKGFYLENISTLSMDNICLARIQNTDLGCIIHLRSIHLGTLNNIQIESASYTGTFGGIAIGACQAITISCMMQNATFTSGTVTPYIKLYQYSTGNIIIKNIFEAGTITNSTYRQFINSDTGLTQLRLEVLDGNITPNLCTLPSDVLSYCNFVSQLPGVNSKITNKRIIVPEASATNILSLAPFGMSASFISGLYTINGIKNSSSEAGFIDLLMIGSTYTTSVVTVISSNNISSYSSTRSYSVVNNNLLLTTQVGVGNTSVMSSGLNQSNPFIV